MFTFPMANHVAPLPLPFISSWKTTNAGSANTTIVIPTSSTGQYSCYVDWGDGNTSTLITTYNDAQWTHVYSLSGTYTVTISGIFRGITFNSTGDRLKILNISQWGTMRLGTTEGSYFFGCSNLTITATDILNLGGTTSLAKAFQSCTSITTIPSANSWITSGVTLMNQTFQSCFLFNQDVGNWDTSNVTAFDHMFESTLFNHNLNSWNTAKVTSMTAMFDSTTAFNGNISSWNTGAVTSANLMFKSATAFNQNISSWNTAKMITMTSMFSGATAFNQDVSQWNITAMTDASSMFTSSAFSLTNYNLLLNNITGWPSQSIPKSNVTFSAGSAHYSAGAPTTGRAILTGTYGWIITDGGTP